MNLNLYIFFLCGVLETYLEEKNFFHSFQKHSKLKIPYLELFQYHQSKSRYYKVGGGWQPRVSFPVANYSFVQGYDTYKIYVICPQCSTLTDLDSLKYKLGQSLRVDLSVKT